MVIVSASRHLIHLGTLHREMSTRHATPDISFFSVHIAQVILHLVYRKNFMLKPCLKFLLENLCETQEKLKTMEMQNIGG